MPYFDFECKVCNKIFEAFQHMDEKELEFYPHFNNGIICYGPVERKISAPALRFVGKGFYCNDYPKDTKS
jgi:putative FmdB family regulatory protein